MPSYTLDELIVLMGPHYERDKVLIRDCVAGLTLYGAQHAQTDPDSPKVSEIRDLVDHLECYWCFNDFVPGHTPGSFLSTFDAEVETAKRGAMLGDASPHRAATVYGLYHFGEEMVTAQGDEAKNEILYVSGLIKEIAAAWDFESTPLDNLIARLEAWAHSFDDPARQPSVERETAAGQVEGPGISPDRPSERAQPDKAQNAQGERESVLAKIREAQKNPAPREPKQKKLDKHGLEL